MASLIASVLLVLAFRRHLFANAFNRRTVLAFLVLVCSNVAERIFLTSQMTPLRTMFTSELATIITGVAIVAVVHMRRVGAVLVPLSAGIVAMNTLPYRPQGMSAATLAVAYATTVWALAGRRARHAEPPR